MPSPEVRPPRAAPKVAYVLNGFPRPTEAFIAHEVHQLERLGLSLRLFAVKREQEPQVPPVAASIRSPLTYLPRTTSIAGATLPGWMVENLPAVWRAHARVAVRHPLRWAGTLGAALALAWRHRGPDHRGRTRLRKGIVKAFVHAGQVADEVMRAGDVRHLHGHFCHDVTTITWFTSRLTGIPYSFTAHARDTHHAGLNPGDLLERKLGNARFVATCSSSGADLLRRRHPRPAEVHLIRHGLDTDELAPPQQPPRREPGAPPLVLSIGRFVAGQGFEHLIEACARLRDRGLAFECLIVGDRGSALDTMRRLIERRGLTDRVRLRGALPPDELRALQASARVFALPCQEMADGDHDGFPQELAESMALGVPVVSTRIGGVPELIDDGVHGLLVEPRDPEALAEALHCVLDNDALQARLSREARAHVVARFDSRRTTRALRDLFQAQLDHPEHQPQPGLRTVRA